MRTLKKVLALSLVFAMAFTMMAGAAFKDQNKIDSSLNDDISLLTALGVFKGDENGNFNPTANVKRSEAAKMIYVLKNNGVDDGAVAFQGVSKYADVPVGHWAEGYINYCTNLGYMGGWKEGNVQKFDPNGNVTGVELMKMLLCMIGYKADVQGYTGNGWQTKVLVDATTSGLSVEFVPSVYAATPRQWTARLMTNAINAPYVSYNRGELQFGNAIDSTKSYAEQYLGLETATGKLTAVQNVAAVANGRDPAMGTDNKDCTIAKYTDKAGTPNVGTAASFEAKVSSDLLGQVVKVYFKKSASGTGLADAQKVYAVLPVVSKVYNVTADSVTMKDLTDTATLEFDGYNKTTYTDTTDKVTVYTDFVAAATKVDITDASTLFGTNDNRTLKLVDVDGNGKIDDVYVSSVTYAVVDKFDAAKTTLTMNNGAVSPSSVTIPGLTFGNNDTGKENWKKINIVGNLAKGDVVAITKNYSTGKLIYDVTEVSPVTGKVESFTMKDATDYATVTVNGTTYKVAATAANANVVKNTGSVTKLTECTNFYTDGKYIVYASGEKASENFPSNIAYVIDVDTGSKTWPTEKAAQVKVITADNTIKTYDYVAADNTPSGWIKYDADQNTDGAVSPATPGTVAKNGLYEYQLIDGKIVLKVLPATVGKYTYGTSTDFITYSTGTKLATIDAKNYMVNSDTIFFVEYKDSKFAAVKGSEIGAFGKTASTPGNNQLQAGEFVVDKTTGMPVLKYAEIKLTKDTSSSVSSGTKYAVVTGAAKPGQKIDNTYTEVLVPVVTNDGTTELKVKVTTNTLESQMATLTGYRNKLYEYTVSGAYATFGSQVTAAAQGNNAWTSVAVKSASSSNLYVTTGTADLYYNITSNTKIVYVDASETNLKVVDGEGVPTAANLDEAASDNLLNKNALVLGKANNDQFDASMIIVEINGKALPAMAQ